MPNETALPLRVVIVCARKNALPAWVARLIEQLHADPRISLVGTLSGIAVTHTKSTSSAMLAVERLAMRFKSKPYSTELAESLLAELPVLDGMREQCSAPLADIALALTPQSLAQADLESLVSEEWSLLMANAPAHNAENAIMSYLANGAPLIPLTLKSRTAHQPKGKAVFTAQYNVKPSAILMSEFLLDKAVIFFQRALICRALHRDIDSGVEVGSYVRSAPVEDKVPGYAAQVLKAVVRRMKSALRESFGRPVVSWELRTGESSPEVMDLSDLTPLSQDQWLMADPFLFEHDGTLFVFYEVMDKQGGSARIDVGRLNGTTLEPLGEALRCDYHLSFPQVFAHDGAIYMMPETHETNRLEIWRATQFPLKWELHSTALEGKMPADSVLFQQRGKWWLFTNLSYDQAFLEHSSALYLFQVDGPALKKVVPHRLNPVVVGSDVARNAGGIISAGGELFRPSQNNSFGVYGYGLNLMRIDQLDMQDYRETLVRRVLPDELTGAMGVHHLSFSQGRFVIDVFVDRNA